MSTFDVLVDTPQWRLQFDGVSTLVGAEDWDYAASTNIYIDGITGTVFLQPNWHMPNFATSNSGIYAKLPPSAFTLTPSSSEDNWSYPAVDSDGSQFIKYSNNTSGFGGLMTTSVAVNQPMIVTAFTNSTNPQSDLFLDFGWGTSGDYTTGVSLRFYADYSCDVYQEGNFLAHYALSGQISEYGQSTNQIPGKSTSSQSVSFYLIPCRERELLVLCSAGGGFSHIFEDIAEGDTTATITPNAPFWFYAPAGVDTQVRVAKMQFASSGNAVGKLSFWTTDPGASPIGGFQYSVDCYLPASCTATCTASDGVNPTSAYSNNTNGVRANVALVGTGSATPSLYGCRMWTYPMPAETVGSTSGEGLNVTTNVLALNFDSSDSISGTRMQITLNDPQAIIAAGATLDSTNKPGALIDLISERPWQVFDFDGNQIMEGLNEEPQFIDGTIVGADGTQTYSASSSNKNQRVEMAIRDGWLIAENYIFKEPIPLDGMSVAAAYTLICDAIGLTNSSGIGPSGPGTVTVRAPAFSTALSTTYIADAGNPTKGYNMEIQPGDRGSEWLDRLHKTYAANYFHGLTPMDGWWQPYVFAEADMPSTPAVSLYDSLATAIANGVTSPTVYQLFRTLNVRMLKPEANDIYVKGYDVRTQRPILVHQADTVNMDPTVTPANRKPAWRGSRVSCAWVDPTLTTVDIATYAMGLLYPRLTIARSMIEIETDFTSVLPRGALVKLYFAEGGGIKDPSTGVLTNPATCRIRSVNARFQQVGADGSGARWRPTKYVGQFGLDASNTHTMHTSLAGMQAEWALRLASKHVVWGDANDKPTWRRPLILQSEA